MAVYIFYRATLKRRSGSYVFMSTASEKKYVNVSQREKTSVPFPFNLESSLHVITRSKTTTR